MVLSSSANLYIKTRMSSMYNCDSVAVLNYYRRNNPHKPIKKTAHFYVSCGLQKLNTLNLRLFHSPSNPRNHFSTVLIETNWYTTSCKYSGCSNLTFETIPNSVKYIGSEAFAYCVKLTSITIPNSVTEICSRTFYHCSRLTSVTIPNSVTSICNRSFEGCGLTSVTIPSSVRNIESNAFADCNLKNVYCYMESIPSTGTLAFGESAAYITFHVPACSISDYQNIAPWSEFGNIVALSSGDEEPTVKKCATPTISYTKGKLSFKCATNGASYVTTITDTDIKTHNGNEIDLTVTYNISVYATAAGFKDSDAATATLCWIDSNPKTEGITNSVAKVEARPTLIQSSNGVLTITSEGNTEVTPIKVYNTAGQMVSSSSMTNGMTTLDSNMDSGEIAIVKIGEKSVKVVVK